MAQNEFRIDDLVDRKVLQDLSTLDSQLKALAETFNTTASQMARGLNDPVRSYSDLIEKTNRLTEAQATLVKSQQEMSQVSKEAEALRKQAIKEAEQKQKQLVAEAKANDLAAAAELKRAKAETERVRQAKIADQQEKKKVLTTKEAIALAKQEVNSIQQALDMNRQLRQAVRNVTDAEEAETRARSQLNAKILVNTSYIKRNSDAYTQQKMTIGDYRNQVMFAIEALRSGERPAQALGIAFKGMGGIMKESVLGGLNKVSVSLKSMVAGMVGAQAVIAGIRALAGEFKAGFTTAMNFQESTSRLAAILGTTADKIEDLTKQARKLGSETRYTAAEASALQLELAKLGFTVDEIKNVTPDILKFAQATGSELAEAASLAGAALRMYGAESNEVARYVSAMAVATTKSAMSFATLQTALPIVGAVAKQSGFSIEETLALLGRLSDAGMDASSAATATRNILLYLADGSSKLSQALGGGVHTFDEFISRVGELTDKGIDLAEMLELTDKRSVASFANFVSGAESIKTLKDNITEVTDEFGAMADTMEDNTAGSIRTLKSAWEEFMIVVYGDMSPFRSFFEWLTNAVRDLTSMMKSTAAEINEILGGASALPQDNDAYRRSEGMVRNRAQEIIKEGHSEAEALKIAANERIEVLKMAYKREKDEYEPSYENFQSLQGHADSEYLKQYATRIAQMKSSYLTIEQTINQLQSAFMGGAASPSSGSKPMTASAQKAEKDRSLQIEEDYQNSVIELMDKGLEREIAEINISYTKKIAAITGNSEKEQQTRINLGLAMAKAVEEKRREYELKEEQETQRQKEELMKARIDKIASEAERMSINRNTELTGRLAELDKQYGDGTLTERAYRRAVEEAESSFAIANAQAAIETAQNILEVAQESGVAADVIEGYELELAKKQMELSNAVADNDLANIRKRKERNKELMQLVQQSMQTAMDISGSIANMIQDQWQNRIDGLSKQLEDFENDHSAYQDRISQLEEIGAISTEEANARKRAAEDKTQQKRDEIAQKQASISIKQAKLDKAMNIMQTTMNTATAIMKAWSQGGMFAAPIVAMIAASGAVQLASIIAAPLPKYKHGTDYHKGGLAMVGDGGKQEGVIIGNDMYMTPSKPTIVDLPKGAKVIPDVRNIINKDGLTGDMVVLPTKDGGVVVNLKNDYSRLENRMNDNTNEMRKMAREFRKASTLASLNMMKGKV